MTNAALSDEEIRALEKLCAEATPGPWEADELMHRSEGADVFQSDSGGTICTINFDSQTGDHQPGGDLAFIAACDPPTILALIQEVRALRTEKDASHSGAGDTTALDPSYDDVNELDHLLKRFADSILHGEGIDADRLAIQNHAAALVQTEREACALAVWDASNVEIEGMTRATAPLRREIAKAIRARSTTPTPSDHQP